MLLFSQLGDMKDRLTVVFEGFFNVNTYVFKIGIHFEKSSDIWPRHHNAQNYWSSGEPPLPRYACIYHPSEISSFTVVENVFTLTIRVLTQIAEFFFRLINHWLDWLLKNWCFLIFKMSIMIHWLNNNWKINSQTALVNWLRNEVKMVES